MDKIIDFKPKLIGIGKELQIHERKTLKSIVILNMNASNTRTFSFIKETTSA